MMRNAPDFKGIDLLANGLKKDNARNMLVM